MNTTDQPTPEPGWRMLDVGEVIQEGAWQREWIRDDQWTEWHKATHWIGSQVPDSEEMQFRIRRLPSQPETPIGPPDALPPKDEAQGETPRTDAELLTEYESLEIRFDMLSDFARTLERELIAAQRALAAAEGEVKALKAQPLPVPQTPQEHIEDVMKVGFDRGCG